MADSRKTTGIYYGEKFLDLVQLGAKNKPAKIVSVEGKIEGALSTTVSDGSELSQGTKQDIAQKLQLAFNKNSLSPNNVALSLPTRDIIFRSFVIPWMQSHEVKGVVDFEAGKYVPFPLAELSYSFYPLTITEGGNKRIRVTFVAIKKTELDKYVNMLGHANIRANYIEPSATSLIRTLVYKKILKLDATSAIVSKEGHAGKIIIVEQGVPQFVREFMLRVPSDQGAGGNDEEALLNRLNNEIRISLDYFNRQNNQIQAKEIIFISDTDPAFAAQKLQEDMRLPTVAYTIASILGHPEAKGLGSIHAYGVGLIRAGVDSATFNLAPDTKQGKNFKIGGFGSSKADYKQTVLVAAATIGLSLLIIYGTSAMSNGPKKELAELESKLSVWKDAAIPKLKQSAQELSEKVDLYKSMVVKTEVANVLDHLPSLLPEGVWVDSMEITYKDPVLKPTGGRVRGRSQGDSDESSVMMTIEGFAYSKDKKQQFKVVDDFVSNLRDSEEFKKYFSKIDSGGKTTQTIDNYTVTAFTVTCE